MSSDQSDLNLWKQLKVMIHSKFRYDHWHNVKKSGTADELGFFFPTKLTLVLVLGATSGCCVQLSGFNLCKAAFYSSQVWNILDRSHYNFMILTAQHCSPACLLVLVVTVRLFCLQAALMAALQCPAVLPIWLAAQIFPQSSK